MPLKDSPNLDSSKISHTALYLAVAIILPFLFHQFGVAGRIFLPMHIPVLLCGLTVGALPGIIVGLLGPFISHMLIGMPPAYAVPLMCMELPVYGLVAALTFRKFGFNIYLSLLSAIIIGRIVFAFGLFILGLFISLPYGPAQLFAAGSAFLTGIPGVIIQIVIIPPTVLAIKRIRRGAGIGEN
jgi:hypothetical protein